jgi:hypothetical protein
MSSMEGKVCSVPAQAADSNRDRVRPSIHKLVRVWYDEIVYTISTFVAVFFLQLPMEDIDGNPAPTIIFKGQPYTFHAFLVSVAGTCCGFNCCMYFRDRNPKAASIFRRLGSGAMLASVVVFLWAAAPAGFTWLASLVC